MALAEANSYEEQRRRQVEENKRKLEELRLHHLSAAVRQSQAAAKPKPKRKAPPPRDTADAGPPRRSGRIATLPEQPEYRSERRNQVPHYTKACAITKAEEIKDQLGSDHPTFIKPITHAYATQRFYLIIPVHFAQHLPVRSEKMVLVDEMNNKFDVHYHCQKDGASNHRHQLNGWKRFAAHHKLADGDCLVFQLMKTTRNFKVYIVRASSYNNKDH